MEPWIPTIKAAVDVHPNALNLRSKGKWITACVGLPEVYSVGDINVSTILLNDEVPVERSKVSGKKLMVKFSRTELTSYSCHDLGIKYGNVTLTISGKLFDGTPFEGSNSIRVVVFP